jgi:phosphatase NudJ
MVWKPSVTVAAIVEHDGRFLLVQEHTLEGLKLNNPAGHLELGESPIEACVREVLEETARPFVPLAFLGCYLSRFRRHIHRSVNSNSPLPLNIKEHDTNGSIVKMEDISYLRLAFLGRVENELAGRSYDKEIVRTLWLSPDEIRARSGEHRSPLVMQCIDDALAGRSLPLEAVFTHDSVFASR